MHLTASIPEHEVSWTVTDALGMVIKSNHRQGIDRGVYMDDIDLNDMLAGIYFLNIHSGRYYAFKKFLVIK